MAQDSKETPKSETEKPLDHRRSEDYVGTYANNVYYEPSVWDLKLIFGELDQKLGANVIVQRTGVTLPWNHAKVLFHFLRVHLAAYEAEHGRIEIPKNILTEVSATPPENVEPHIWEAVVKAHKQTLAENPGTVVGQKKQ
jgi:hypothetical protein